MCACSILVIVKSMGGCHTPFFEAPHCHQRRGRLLEGLLETGRSVTADERDFSLVPGLNVSVAGSTKSCEMQYSADGL